MLLSNSHLQWGDNDTYMEVQLTAPGVTSYGAVWVGFPVLRQCFTEFVGWTQTTNGPTGADVYRLTLKDGGYVLDGATKQFDIEKQVICSTLDLCDGNKRRCAEILGVSLKTLYNRLAAYQSVPAAAATV